MDINKAIQEILSAQSALNMEPSPLRESKGTYLSETDYWAEHAYEHLNQALQALTDKE